MAGEGAREGAGGVWRCQHMAVSATGVGDGMAAMVVAAAAVWAAAAAWVKR